MKPIQSGHQPNSGCRHSKSNQPNEHTNEYYHTCLLPRPVAIFLTIILPFACVWAQTNPPADVTISGIGTDVDFGWQVAPAGDVNGDGVTDLIVGDPSNSSVAQFAGRAYLF